MLEHPEMSTGGGGVVLYIPAKCFSTSVSSDTGFFLDYLSTRRAIFCTLLSAKFSSMSYVVGDLLLRTHFSGRRQNDAPSLRLNARLHSAKNYLMRCPLLHGSNNVKWGSQRLVKLRKSSMETIWRPQHIKGTYLDGRSL